MDFKDNSVTRDKRMFRKFFKAANLEVKFPCRHAAAAPVLPLGPGTRGCRTAIHDPLLWPPLRPPMAVTSLPY